MSKISLVNELDFRKISKEEGRKQEYSLGNIPEWHLGIAGRYIGIILNSGYMFEANGIIIVHILKYKYLDVTLVYKIPFFGT